MKKSILLYIIVSVFSFTTYAQQSKINKGDKKYANYAYIDAIKTYERVANKGYKNEDMFKKLGDSYYFNSNFEGAEKWYSQLYAMNKNLESEYYYRYAQSLKATGNEAKANQILEEFNTKFKDDKRGKLIKDNSNYLEKIKQNSGRYNIKSAEINSAYSDYGSFVYKNKLYFTSARDTGNFVKRKHKWTGENFTNLYVANLDSLTKNPSGVKKIDSKEISTKFNESSPVFTKDGNTVYFTRNNYLNGKKGKNDKKTTLIKIYKATLENGHWINVTQLPFSSDNYSTAHPALSPDEKTLYFASDMPGTLGQSDIYKVAINNGNFSTPENLGRSINTEGKETFPYVTNEDEIYFASDGHPGLGGLDVFVGKLNGSNTVSNIQNLGSDINSPKDDFAYIIDPVSRKGYFSSNKDGGNGSDDIYMFLENKRLKCEQELSGFITDAATNLPLPGATVSLYDQNFVLKNSVIADATGNYKFAVECGESYNVRVQMLDYEPKEQNILIADQSGKTTLSFALAKQGCTVAIGDDLGKCFGIKMIYFDLDKSNIRQEAAFDLEKILDVLQQHPTMKLDIRSHTDSRATAAYNMKLSQRRAKSTLEWLVKNGVNSERLSSKGYGESQLINRCSDGVKCSEAEHQMNRRSEFIITAL